MSVLFLVTSARCLPSSSAVTVTVTVAVALFENPLVAVWVVILFIVIQQLEGHIVVPNVMGNALRLHPLLVIFGLLAGAEIYGILGIFIVLPLLAVLRALWEFFAERVTFEPWTPAVAGSAGVTIAEPETARAKKALPAKKRARKAAATEDEKAAE